MICPALDMIFLVEVQQSINFSSRTFTQWDGNAFYKKFWNGQFPLCSNTGTIGLNPMLSVRCGRCFHTSPPLWTSRQDSPWLRLDLRADAADRNLNHFLPSLCFALQRKRTASCGLLTGRVTRASLCRVLSAACPTRWSWLAGELLIVHSTRSKCRDPPCIFVPTLVATSAVSRLRSSVSSLDDLHFFSSTWFWGWCLKNAIFAPVCLQRSLLAAVAGGCHHEDVWSCGRGADEEYKEKEIKCTKHWEAAHPRWHGKHSRCVWAPVVYREAPTVFITLGFLRVASVNKQVLVDSQLILHWNSHSLCVCRRRDTFFSLSLPAFSPHVLYFHYAAMNFLCVPQMHYAEGDYIFRQGAAGDTFYIISKGQVKVLAHYRDKIPALFSKWSLDRANWLFSPLFLFILSLSFQWTICQVKVMEKKPGQEEAGVLSRLTERQWFGEKALWG